MAKVVLKVNGGPSDKRIGGKDGTQGPLDCCGISSYVCPVKWPEKKNPGLNSPIYIDGSQREVVSTMVVAMFERQHVRMLKMRVV